MLALLGVVYLSDRRAPPQTAPAVISERVLLSTSIQVARVESSVDMRRFLEFPYEQYRDDPYWVPPLRLDSARSSTRRTIRSTEHAKMECFLAYLDGRVCGRIAAIFDRDFNAARREKVGTFGFLNPWIPNTWPMPCSTQPKSGLPRAVRVYCAVP